MHDKDGIPTSYDLIEKAGILKSYDPLPGSLCRCEVRINQADQTQEEDPSHP